MRRDFEDGSIIREPDTLRWRSNDQFLPDDFMEMAFEHGLVTEHEVACTKAARRAQTDDFLAEYRRNQKPPTEEELYEMRAAFGLGETVVDVITGRRTKL